MNVTVKLKEDLVKQARHRAVDQNMSLSAWTAKLIEKELGFQEPNSPGSLLERLGDERLADIPFPLEKNAEAVREPDW